MSDQDESRIRLMQSVDEFQRYLERLAQEHEKLRVMCHSPEATEGLLKIVEALDEVLRQSIGQVGDLAAVLFFVRTAEAV